MKIFLSHVLEPRTPGFGGRQEFSIQLAKQIMRGDSNNSQRWEMSNHVGTHIDAPFHFDGNGATIESFNPDFWIPNKICLIDIPKGPNQMIGCGDLAERVPLDSECILIRTGFERLRQEVSYWEENPGVLPEVGSWLRTHRPSIRFFGFDFISLTAYNNREVGRLAHQAFLATAQAGKPILIIEDMHLTELKSNPSKLWIVPLRVLSADGAPATIIAEFG
jgi:arylformamidase